MRPAVIMFLVWVSAELTSGMAAAGAPPPAALLGIWVQDQVGPVLTYERVLRFSPDGSYEFLFTVRNRGATARTVLVRERGRFTVQGGRLTFIPRSGPRRAFPWRVDRDPYVGDVRLVLVMPDGILDVYYRR
ncbi:MAG: hypothetical protein QN141_02255 [Armatimonadota bacterium]|nr:hypothetical protein [Armatimonadota bacterium]MDR7450723.1 hypothetical protein [Armatimonadota bacterium]MDR7466079.1 hypothetical protein [Armatimonadota bacterium]MDR7493884.1 hypothetical protein [Armatimonadota bacterium]MDR7498955.1 hypothetical protein [Armatimonadota bacterium]